jgi:hypothetical protein
MPIPALGPAAPPAELPRPPAPAEVEARREDIQDRPRRRRDEDEETDVQGRPRRRDADREEPDVEDRPRRRRGEGEEPEARPRGKQGQTSGKAVTSLILGLASFVCLCSFLTGLPGIILGFLALGDVGRSGGRQKGKGLAITGIVAGCLGTLFVPVAGYFIYTGLRSGVQSAVTKVQVAAGRAVATNNLKEMALAMHSYNDRNGTFPPSGYSMPPGQSNLSWRVALLPYLQDPGAQALYNQFHHNEPWDSPHNKTLLTRMPTVYAIPGRESDAAAGKTVFQVFVGPGSAFENKTRGVRLAEIGDGLSNTLFIAEAAGPVPWTRPDDLTFDPNRPLPALGGHFGDGFLAAFGDMTVHWSPRNTPEKTIKAYVTRNGAEIVAPPP